MTSTDPGFTLVANAGAGSSDRDVLEGVRDELAANGASVEVVWTGDPDELADVVAGLGGGRLVVAGGDGSISAAVDALVRAGRGDVEVGLVPLGTGNDLARGMGIPLDANEAARLARDGDAVGRPVIRLLPGAERGDGTRFAVNALHMGVGASAADRARGLKSVLGPAAYPVGAVAAGASDAGWDVELVVDDREVVAARALMCACMLGTSIGGGTEVVPDSTPRQAAMRRDMEVVVVGATGAMARVGFALALVGGEHLERDDVVHGPAARLSVRSDPPIPLNLDGELIDPMSELVVEVEPEAWRLVVPAADEGDRP